MNKVKGAAKAGKTSATWTGNSAEVKALHVMLLPDGHGWFAQGLEIDYAACGGTFDEAKNNFIKGLGLTVCENLVMYGHIEKVLTPAPKEAWNEFYNTPADGIKRHTLSLKASFEELHTQKEQVDVVQKAIPFNAIQFLKPEAVAA